MSIPTNPAIPKVIVVLGLVSLFMDISSEMIHALLPVFMVTVLGSSATTVGIIEGLGEGLALIVRVFSGALSDWLARRKRLILIGYLLGTLSKPLFAIATASGMVMFARSIDRIGKGIRGAPRDALIADISPKEMRGAAYGLRQSLDSLGALLGPLLAIVLMALTMNDYRQVFLYAVIPGSISLLLIIFFVKEPVLQAAAAHLPLKRDETHALPSVYWWVLGIGICFTLARFSEAFMILRGESLGLDIYLIPSILMTMSLFYTLGAYPAGRWSDRLGRVSILRIGLLMLIIADLILANASSILHVFIGAALWGLHMAFSQGIFSALVADSVTETLRGTAFGLYGLATGCAIIIASVFAGWLWDQFGAHVTFYAGVVFSLLTLLGLQLVSKRITTTTIEV